ncbi:Protein-tyrosine-phosphatase [Cohaesibacter sp. ES.047]|uniref:arsenate-mycothiol transferase ArsC n=1 Tax=Cohaesibacter sp. ES.047 TaxID=1798205 RepID=UPI000BB80B00|nr:hypothetical protein [Cohaesibacter sp. ES.047]SNY90656.1 Protein-tyrosine-phosphatase [Cohaesibacter sp. ES.047]
MLQTNILFVDEANNDRSILAEAYFNQGRDISVRAFSAGVNPDVELDRAVYEVMREKGIRPDDYCPKPIDIFLQPYSPRIDLVVGFGSGNTRARLPMLPHHPSSLQLMVDALDRGFEGAARKRAIRDCYADVGLAIDRAKAKGLLPSSQAA